jgi:beta-galactosidase
MACREVRLAGCAQRAWYRGFRSWEEVQPPRFSTILTYSDYTDWKTFIATDSPRSGDRDRAVRAGGSKPPDDLARRRIGDNAVAKERHRLPGRLLHGRPGRLLRDVHLSETQSSRRALALLAHHVDDGVPAERQSTQGWVVSRRTPGRTWHDRTLAERTRHTRRSSGLGMVRPGVRRQRAINMYAYYPMSSGYESGGYGLINLDGIANRACRARWKDRRGRRSKSGPPDHQPSRPGEGRHRVQPSDSARRRSYGWRR